MFVTEKLKTFSWVNVGNPDHEDFEKLQTEYKIDEDTISDILDPDEQPRLEVEDDYKVIIVRFPIINRENDTLWHTEPLSIIMSPNRVITVCRKRCDLLDRIKKSEKTSREEFILNIMYYIAESYLRMLKELNKRVLASKRVLTERIRKQELMNLLEVENSYTLYLAGIKGNVSVLDKLEKAPDENPSIGIILCAEKDHLEVELALQDVNKPIGVAEYQYLIPKNKLQELVANEMKISNND